MKCNKCIHSDVCYKYLDVMDDRYSPSYVENCVDFKEENLQPNIYRIVVIYKDEINMHNYKELADKNGGKLFTSRHHAHYINDYIRIDFVPLSQTCRGLRAHEILIDRESYNRIDVEDVDIIEQVFLPMLRDYTSTVYPLHKCFRLQNKYSELLEQVKQEKSEVEWLLLKDCANSGVYCGKCYKKVYKEKYANQKILSKYCPNCGARMKIEMQVK